MSEALSRPAGGAAEELPEYPLPRAAQCPLAPAPAAQELRAERPITKVRIWNGSTPWLVTRHADQRALLPDPRVSDDDLDPGFPHVNAHRAMIAPVTPRLITNTDAPEHTRLRRTVNGPFLVKRIEKMRAPVQKIVDDLIDTMLAGPRPVDLLTAFALPVPSLVIAELLGVPYEDHGFFQRSSSLILDGASAPEEARRVSGELAAYLDDLIKRKTDDPGEDVLSEMAGRVRDGEMSHTEAVHMGVAMLIAGHETTATMISLGTLALFGTSPASRAPTAPSASVTTTAGRPPVHGSRDDQPRDVVVVTGAGGMGSAVARRLGSGRTLILADASRTRLDRTVDALRAEGYAVRGVPHRRP
ncbi:hypothetical protein SHIRM173S_08442 [Streptomyces hirsutus]